MKVVFKKYDEVYANDMCGIKIAYGILENANKDPIINYPIHRHDYFEIEWLAEGKIHHELNGEKSILSVGDIYVLSTVDLHKIDVIETPIFHKIGIDYKNAPKAIQHILGKVTFPRIGHLEEDDLKEVEDCFHKLYYLTRERPDGFLSDSIIAYTLLMLIRIFNCTESAAPILGNNGYHHISRALEYISKNYNQPLSLGSVAKAISISANHLSMLFTKITGKSFLDHLTEFRIKKAQAFLMETDQSITEISYNCGFGSFQTFSRSFKQVCGCSPSEYRKNSRI